MNKPITKLNRLKPLNASPHKRTENPSLVAKVSADLGSNAKKSPIVVKQAVESTQDPRDLIGWSVVKLHDEATGRGSYQFSIPNSIGSQSICELSMALSIPELVKQLRAYSFLPARHTANSAIEKLLKESTTVLIRSEKPGWKPDNNLNEKSTAFVLPNAIIPSAAGYRWSSAVPSRLGEARGTLEAWNKEVAEYGRMSNYIAFGIMAALACPLIRIANLPESVVFNLYGPSSVGKTTVARVAMSSIGPAECIQNWDLKARALEEVASRHNDCPLILNGAERLSPVELKQFATRVVHMLPDGVGTFRSVAVHDQLPNATWRNVVLSTSNPPGREMGGRWEEQDSVRFIDIPVPPVEEGGIFDRIKVSNARGLLGKIENGIAANYGVLWPHYIEHLLTLELSAVVGKYVQEYLILAKAASGIEERIAKKFAICFAAGRIAQQAGLLKWHSLRPAHAVQEMHERSASARCHPSENVKAALDEIAIATFPMIRNLSQQKGLVVTAAGKWIGVQTIYKGAEVIGLRREDLQARYSVVTASAVIAWLENNALIVGSSNGTQLHVDLTIGTKKTSKPRFILVDIKKMKLAIS